MLAVEVDQLRKTYGGRTVIDGVTFDIPHGQVLALLGPNGAGKTTTVETLEGFRSPDSGTVRLLGHDPQVMPRRVRGRIGVVLQETRHDPYLTVAETLDLARGWYADPLSTEQALALVSLTEAAGRRVSRLSGGQQRRLDVALGVLGQPDVLFLDEPTTGFDPVARREAWEVVSRLRGRGTTVVLTTHYMDEAAVLSDRIIVLAQGRILADSPSDSFGGRDRVHEVSIRLSAQPQPGALAALHRLAVLAGSPSLPAAGPPADERCIASGRWGVTTDDVTALLHALVDWSREHQVPLDDLHVARPSLEDTYLRLVA